MPLSGRVVATLLLLLSGAACSSDASTSGGGALEGGDSQVVGEADEGIEGVQAIRVADNTHTESIVDYALRPPAGGAHNPVWWNCGFYDEAVPDEHAVHDLEHGVVWLAYDPALAPADVDRLHALAPPGGRVLASPYPALAEGAAVVATAWARQLTLDSVDDPRLEAFLAEYTDGSQAPEAGASCSGTPFGDPLP